MATKAELEVMLEEAKAENQKLEQSQELLTEEIQEVRKETLDKEKDFSTQMDELKSMMIQMQMSQMQTQNTGNKKGLQDTIAVRSNIIGINNGTENISLDRDSEIPFTFGETEDVLVSDVQMMMKYKNNKKLFVNGLLEFEDHDNYATFNVKPRKILTDEYIIDLFLNNEPKEFLKELKYITMEKKINSVVHNLTHRAGLLYKNQQLEGVKYGIMEAFKGYFGIGLMELNIHLLETE